MSEEKNTAQQKNNTKTKATKEATGSGNKPSTGIISKFGFVMSIAALGLSGYVVVNSQLQVQKNVDNNKTYSALENQVSKFKQYQDEQKSVLDDVSSQNDAQTDSIKALQSQITSINSQIATPTKDLYMQMNIANLQSAIDYLVLAKDVVTFAGDTQKGNDLVDMAFEKAEASKVVNISVTDRQDIKNALNKFSSKNDILKDFASIEQQVGKLKYLTAQNISDNKDSKPDNKYMKFLSSVIQVQDIPKDQILVSTKKSKQIVANGLYQSLISLQNALYTNNPDSIEKSKDNLIKIVKKYFVQNNDAKTLEEMLLDIKSQNMQNIDDSLDKVISQLSK